MKRLRFTDSPMMARAFTVVPFGLVAVAVLESDTLSGSIRLLLVVFAYAVVPLYLFFGDMKGDKEWHLRKMPGMRRLER